VAARTRAALFGLSSRRAGRANQLMMALARHRVAANPQASGVFYVDGHGRAHHGRAARRYWEGSGSLGPGGVRPGARW